MALESWLCRREEGEVQLAELEIFSASHGCTLRTGANEGVVLLQCMFSVGSAIVSRTTYTLSVPSAPAFDFADASRTICRPWIVSPKVLSPQDYLGIL
jgi:hypothetical protein